MPLAAISWCRSRSLVLPRPANTNWCRLAAIACAACATRRSCSASPLRASVPPEGDTALHAGLVRDDGAVRIEGEVDLLGVAAADIQVIEAGEPAQIADRLHHSFVPACAADLLACGVAELLIVGFAVAEGVMRDLKM